ncbi:MAG: radical SAM protein [Candidatus Omnitrophica bacterium]|nr:radical SAM protein [Candidatus Omnitrophota bacterium]
MNINNYIRLGKKIFFAKITQKKIPLIVILSITNKCNLNCWYCYGEHYKKNNWKDFTTKELLKIIQDLHSLGSEIIQLQGGEPLMRDDIKIIINEVKRLGMICDMVTNGTLIPEKRNVVSQLDKICISLDGPLHINDKNRGKGSFIRIIKGMETACNLGLPVRISAVLTFQTSKQDIDWLIDFALKHSQYRMVVNFSPFFESVSSFEINKNQFHTINNKRLKDIFRYISKQKEKGAPIQFTAKSYKHAAQWPFTYEKNKMFSIDRASINYDYPKCYHGKFIFFIDADGSLYPCCNFWGKSNVNVKAYGLKGAISKLSKKKCQACYIPAYIDRNLFFEGAPKVWWNYFKQVIRERI